MGKNQIQSDISESLFDETIQSIEDLENPEDLSEDTIDLYSYSTQDLINKYKALSRRAQASEDDDEIESIENLLELIEVELLKNGVEITQDDSSTG